MKFAKKAEAVRDVENPGQKKQSSGFEGPCALLFSQGSWAGYCWFMTKQAAVAFLIISLVAVSNGFAADTTPSEASIKQLLEVTQAKKMVDTMNGQMNTMMENAMHAATQGQNVTPKIQKEIDDLEQQTASEVRGVLNWNKLEAMYIRVYQKSFTAEEVDGLVVFYKTQVGQALLTKMPVVIQNTTAEVQQMVIPMMQRMQQKHQQIVSELQAEKAKKGGG